MQVTLKKSSAVTDHLKRTFADPVLWYTVLIMTTIMYHFYKKGYLMFALAIRLEEAAEALQAKHQGKPQPEPRTIESIRREYEENYGTTILLEI